MTDKNLMMANDAKEYIEQIARRKEELLQSIDSKKEEFAEFCEKMKNESRDILCILPKVKETKSKTESKLEVSETLRKVMDDREEEKKHIAQCKGELEIYLTEQRYIQQRS